MATVIIGGTKYSVPELSFLALEKAWPYIEEAMMTQDPMKGPAAGLSVIAAGLVYDEDNFKPEKFGIEESLDEEEIFDRVVYFLKRKLKSSEIQNIIQCMNEITEEAGLGTKGDPQPPPAEESPSTETAPNSSPNSLQPDAKAEAGTA